MSRTSKFTLAAALAFSVVGIQAQAQEKPDVDAAMLATIMQSMGASKPGDVRSEIEARIRNALSALDDQPTQADGKIMTIEEIDKINRSAERERTELEFEKARAERQQLELERLMALYEVYTTIEEDQQKRASDQQARLAALMDKDGDDKDADPMSSKVSQDQSLLPRIDSISGVGGVYTADAEFEGDTMKVLHKGDMTVAGFVVEDIQPSFVMLRGGASKQLFRIVPKAPEPPRSNSPMQPGGVLDLSQFPMAQF